MTDKILSLRQFRERAAEIRETVQIAVRDRDGNLRILGAYTPFLTEPTGPNAEPQSVGLGDIPRVIRTSEDVTAAVAPGVRAFPKSAQTGRRRAK